MPRKQAHCARGAGHPPPCATPEAMERQRQRAADRIAIHGRNVSPVVKARWRQAYKLQRYGLTQTQFGQMLEDQGYACAMGGEPFKDGQRIFIDHDHACCPVTPGTETRCCGGCVRGLRMSPPRFGWNALITGRYVTQVTRIGTKVPSGCLLRSAAWRQVGIG
jgi:Recombination endonuclease VII